MDQPSPRPTASPIARLARRLPPPGRRRVVVLALLAVIPLAFVVAFVTFAVRLGTLRDRLATGPAWVFPSRVYSDGLALLPGRALSADQLVAQLDARDYRPTAAPPIRPGTYAVERGGYQIVLRGFVDAPDPAGHGGPERVRLGLEGGRLARVERLGGLAGAAPPDTLHPARLEPVLVSLLLDRDRVRRSWVPLARVPRALQDAVVASEDRRFRAHLGFDLRSNLRALLSNVEAGSIRQGGSTITQQLARGLFLGRQRTLGRKVREVFLAAGLEILLTKDEILEMYLNSVYWGQGDGGGIAGAAEAARFYFDAPVESLTVAQAAMLAGIIPAPNAYSPFRSLSAARQRRDAVLTDMVQTGALPAAAAARLRREPLRVRRGAPPPERFPSFTGYLRERLRAQVSKREAESWGLALMTTLDPVWQAAAERELAAGVAAQERWHGRGAAPLQGAFVALDAATGEVRAMVAGRATVEGDFNRATQARRQPGSAIKAIVYTAALDPARGGPALTPASTVPDLRREFATPEGPWRPQNNEGDYHETVTLAKALARSLNLATANLVERIGAGTVARYCERFGLGRAKAVPSIGLGTNEVTLLALTDAYAVFPAGGVLHAPTPLRAGTRRPRPRPDAPASRPGARDRRPHRRAHDRAARGRGDLRGGLPAALALRVHPGRGGQDRHHQRPQRRLVRGLHARVRRRGVGGLRHPARPAASRRRGRAAGVGRHRARDDRRGPARGVPRARRSRGRLDRPVQRRARAPGLPLADARAVREGHRARRRVHPRSHGGLAAHLRGGGARGQPRRRPRGRHAGRARHAGGADGVGGPDAYRALFRVPVTRRAGETESGGTPRG